MEMDSLDPAWAHCDSKRSLRNTMICLYCQKRITSGGITSFKYHLAGLPGHGSVCESVPENVKNQMMCLIKGGPAMSGKKRKKGKKGGNVTLAFLKAHGKSKKIKKNKASTETSEIRNNYSHHQSGPAMNIQRRVQTRSRRDKSLDTDVFEYLMEGLWRKVPEEKRRHCIYFDSLWFRSYQDELRSKDELRKNKILKWIKNKRVFSKKGHWSLLILCHFGGTDSSPCMLLLDSLLDAGPKRLENDIRRFVSDIYNISERKKDEDFILDIPFLIPKVPQQIDGEECGAFVLYFMFRFIESAPDIISLDGYPYFLTEEWFTREEFEKFARELKASSMEKKVKGKEHQQSSDNVDPSVEVHTSEVNKNSTDSMESQVSSVPSINSSELKSSQSETLHYIKRRKKAGMTENSSPNKVRENTNDGEDSNSQLQNDSQGGDLSNGTSDKETDGVGPTSDSMLGDVVIGRDKMVKPGKQNSSSSVECLTEFQDTSPRLASVIDEQQQIPLSQNSEPDPNISPLLINSPIWQSLQTMEVFKQVPQRPHFMKLESYCQEVREGMAVGLMVAYVNVVRSIEKLSFDDNTSAFEQKISCLDTLEENGFNVGPLRERLKRLLQIKVDHTGNWLKRDELETQLAAKESANASVLLELDKVGLELTDLRKKVNFLIEQRSKLVAEADQLSHLTSGLDRDIPSLREQISSARKLRESARDSFVKLLAEPL